MTTSKLKPMLISSIKSVLDIGDEVAITLNLINPTNNDVCVLLMIYKSKILKESAMRYNDYGYMIDKGQVPSFIKNLCKAIIRLDKDQQNAFIAHFNECQSYYL